MTAVTADWPISQKSFLPQLGSIEFPFAGRFSILIEQNHGSSDQARLVGFEPIQTGSHCDFDRNFQG